MIPYLVCFVVTPLFTFLAEKNFKESKKRSGILFSFIAILIPAIIAGLRNLTVGVDAEIYVEPILREIKGMSIIAAFERYSLEKGYVLLIYIISFITQNPNVALFIIHLIITMFIYFTSYKCRDKISMTVFMTVYILYMYTKSFNIIRQSLALSIFIYSLAFLFERKYTKTLILFSIALTFHSSIVFCGVIYIIYLFNNLKIKFNVKVLIYILILIITFLLTINMQNIIRFLTYEIKILPETYYKYFLDIIFTNHNYIDLIIKISLMIIACVIIFFDKDNQKKHINITLLESISLGIIFTLGMFFIGQLGEIYRIAFSFILIGIIYIFSNAFNIVKNDLFNKISVYVIIVGVLLLQWLIYYVINGEASLYPYIFM